MQVLGYGGKGGEGGGLLLDLWFALSSRRSRGGPCGFSSFGSQGDSYPTSSYQAVRARSRYPPPLAIPSPPPTLQPPLPRPLVVPFV
jgi:hypothetical protein